jgi:hypothetical protein
MVRRGAGNEPSVNCVMSASLIGRLGSSAFRLSTITVSMSLAGSRFSSESSHHWSRQLQALGHSVKLMPPSYVKPYVKRQKNNMADAEAICRYVARTGENGINFCMIRTVVRAPMAVRAMRGHMSKVIWAAIT